MTTAGITSRAQSHAITSHDAAGEHGRREKGDDAHDGQLPSEKACQRRAGFQFTFNLVEENVLQNEESQPPQKSVQEDEPRVRMREGRPGACAPASLEAGGAATAAGAR